MAALDGILVVALEQAVAAPFCTSRLADAGARVIKIERPGGDFARAYDHVVNGDSAYFVWLNRGKESIVLDIKDSGDKALLHRLIERADIVVQNLAPEAAARAGFDCAELRRLQPRLITCEISGYGDDGPYRDMKAYDLLVQAEAGLCMVTGTPEAPGRVGVSVCDIAAGMNAYGGILQALYGRERNGRGAGVKVSLFDGMADWMNVSYLYQSYGGAPPPRTGLNHPLVAPYGSFTTADEEQVLISIQNEREWVKLCIEVLERPDLATDGRFDTPPKRVENRGALDRIVAESFARWPRAALMERLRRAQIACGALNSVADLAAHPQLRTIDYDGPSAPVTVIAPPVMVAGDVPAYRPVPRLGEHSEAIRAEFAPVPA
ncbi:MAG: CaiB/BaiF CoA-transferase family protein [Alphaproteobacteria bacterium]|nr:CaiB/BaiF CoA-transferase family protein [Alphaproteobacteria bacterium]MDP6516214.1 CaiB/BaiF CoA-transferase family protein [Alphaproteobacteria bacterium]